MKPETIKKAKELIYLNEMYHKYLYLKSLKSLEAEKQRLNNLFN
ncbi:hypothetical protein Harreka1_54 [Olleya phage Harreka_1]|uniref:Uncharacterized protein n=1 Tax=Olleya phage Harreka_1 TaxID=2745673 RepID=A0A8E5EAW2_9CAUD|nr:hypothetical protein M1M26_gp54 [Olleya phage Harreka_1]QQV90461.1 hypothetical protein Harreka1_54 [Olleya phage Harreka_1]